jgi:hypothetical protein
MTQKDLEEKSVWSLSFWEALSFWMMVLAAIAGVVAATSALISRQAARKASEITQHESRERLATLQRESNERIAIAQRDAAEANLKAAEANEKAEGERLGRLKLEEKLAPRSLSEQQMVILCDKLKPFAETSVVIDKLLDRGTDIGPLAHQLVAVLQTAGWVVTANDRLASSIYVAGINVTISPGSTETVTTAGELLINELNLAGIAAAQSNPPVRYAPNVIHVIIGPKP